MGKIKIKKISPKDFGKALYKFTGAQQLVDSGKALSKCKPKDAKCIAQNLGQMAMAAKGLTPAGLASTVAKNVVKDQIKKKLDAEKAKREAKKKLASATTVEEKKAAQAEIKQADKTIEIAEKTVEANQQTIQQADAEKMVALQQIEKAKLDPATAKQAAQVEQQAKHPNEPITTGPAIPTNGEMIMGMPQKKFLMIMGAFAFFILLIVILK
jgi:hypothetical protein